MQGVHLAAHKVLLAGSCNSTFQLYRSMSWLYGISLDGFWEHILTCMVMMMMQQWQTARVILV